MFCIVCLNVCVGSPLVNPVMVPVPLCFCLGLVSDIYIHSPPVQPEANELTELQALKLRQARSLFVILSPLLSCTAEVPAHASAWFVAFDVARWNKRTILHGRSHKLTRKCEGRKYCLSEVIIKKHS